MFGKSVFQKLFDEFKSNASYKFDTIIKAKSFNGISRCYLSPKFGVAFREYKFTDEPLRYEIIFSNLDCYYSRTRKAH
jgi:hypothetical protein